MKRIRISTILGAAAAITLLAGCAGNGTYGTYYGGGYSSTPSRSYGYRQPYPYTGDYRYSQYDRRYGDSYYSRGPYYDGLNYYRR
jgi:hypothetical protein